MGICMIKLNCVVESCIPVVETAFCFYNYYDPTHINYGINKAILKQFQYLLKLEYDDDQTLTLPRQIAPHYKPITISNKNYDDYWNMDKNESEQKKKEDWIESFKNENEKLKV